MGILKGKEAEHLLQSGSRWSYGIGLPYKNCGFWRRDLATLHWGSGKEEREINALSLLSAPEIQLAFSMGEQI